jgi:hypothetical protein
MSIGGVDTILLAPARECIAELLLRACQQHWQGQTWVIQDGDEEDFHLLDDPWVWRVGTQSKEFFVYRDRAAAESWKEGPTPANANTMFHFIIGEALATNPGVREVVVICDDLTPEVQRFLASLKVLLLPSP